MKKNKFTLLTLAVLVALGSMTTSAFAAPTNNDSTSDIIQKVDISEFCDIENQEYAQISIEDHVKSLTSITNEEKVLLLETYNAIDKLYEQMDAIYKDKEELNDSEEKIVEDLFAQVDKLYEKISGIEAKVYGEQYFADDSEEFVQVSNEDYVKGLSCISEEEKIVLLETYNSLDKLYAQIDELYKDVEELDAEGEKKAEALYGEIDKLQSKISPIEEKIFNYESKEVME